MIIDTINFLKAYFQENNIDPAMFSLEDNVSVQLYKNIIKESAKAIEQQYSANSTVIQLDLDGNVLFSGGNTKFALTKDEIKRIPGSVEKINRNTILISDTRNKKASVWQINSIDSTSVFNSADKVNILSDVLADIGGSLSTYDTVWEYTSDRYITSFKKITLDSSISVTDGSSDPDILTVKRGSTIKWINNSTVPIYIYSGKTNKELFDFNPDLSLYGNDFISPELNIGEEWSTTLLTNGTKDWFAYPSIVTGTIQVTEQSVYDSDLFLIVENDGLGYPLSSRIIKVDFNKNITWSFGNGYLINPRKAISLNNNKILIST